jgi:hypothetical protein
MEEDKSIWSVQIGGVEVETLRLDDDEVDKVLEKYIDDGYVGINIVEL